MRTTPKRVTNKDRIAAKRQRLADALRADVAARKAAIRAQRGALRRTRAALSAVEAECSALGIKLIVHNHQAKGRGTHGHKETEQARSA